MTKKEFIEKYPELNDDGRISILKINLLSTYSTHYLSKNDGYVRDLLQDYSDLIISEKRNFKIDKILK